MQKVIKILAEIHLLSGGKGRKTPFKDGYRPLFDFPGTNTKISGQIALLESEEFKPGDKGVVEIHFVNGIIDETNFQQGNSFSFGEGTSVLGIGKIIRPPLP